MLVRVAQAAPDRVLFAARAAEPEAAEWGIERMRLALGIDQDVEPFYDRFRFDPLIGRSVRATPGLRASGKPDPFEALAWAICEQLIEFGRAAAIQRRLIARLGRRCPWSAMRDAPVPPPWPGRRRPCFSRWTYRPGRAVALVRAAREVASGRVDLYDPEPEAGWRRLRAIRGIGSWTIQMLALTGQGRLDQLPAGDVGYLKLVGRLRSGNPYERATEEEVGRVLRAVRPVGRAGRAARAPRGGRSAAARVALLDVRRPAPASRPPRAAGRCLRRRRTAPARGAGES